MFNSVLAFWLSFLRSGEDFSRQVKSTFASINAVCSSDVVSGLRRGLQLFMPNTIAITIATPKVIVMIFFITIVLCFFA